MLASGKEFAVVESGAVSRELGEKEKSSSRCPNQWLGKYSTMARETLRAEASLKLKTRVFELGNGRYHNLSQMAQAIRGGASE